MCHRCNEHDVVVDRNQQWKEIVTIKITADPLWSGSDNNNLD